MCKIQILRIDKPYLHVGLILIIAVLELFSLFGCKVIKTKNDLTTDTTAKHSVDSGSVKTNSGTSKDDSKWWKETVILGKDTGKGNVTNIYPTTIIREGGTSNKESSYKQTDSSWKNAFDSLSSYIKQTTKSKEEQALNMWQILVLAALVFVAFQILSKVISFNNPFKSIQS